MREALRSHQGESGNALKRHSFPLSELNGSWETARSTLKQRRFLLDASQLYSADDEGCAWLLKMKESGAQFLPANYLESAHSQKAPRTPEQVAAIKLSLLGRVMGYVTRRSPTCLD